MDEFESKFQNAKISALKEFYGKEKLGFEDGGRVAFGNGTKVKTPEQYRKNLLTKKRYYEKQKADPNFRQDKTLKDKINLLKNAERTFIENPGLKEAHINNLYRKENGKFVRRYEPLRPFAEVFADFGIKPSMAKEFSSIIRKELKADGSLGTAKESAVKEKRNKNIKEGKADAGPTVKPIQKKLEKQISNYNKIYSDLLEKDPKKLVKTIRQKDNLMDQLESVFKDGEVKKVKISDDEIKKLVKNGLYSEDHKTQVQTGSKNIEYNVNKSFVTKKTNSSVLAPMTMWLNKNYKKEDGKIKDPKIKNIKNWLTKNNINTKIEGEGLYFGDDSLKKISAEEAYKKQLNFLETSSSKLGKTNIAKGLSKILECKLEKGVNCDDPMSYYKSLKEQEEIAAKGKGPNKIKAINKVKAAKNFIYGTLGPYALALEAAIAAPIAGYEASKGALPSEILNTATYGLAGKDRDELIQEQSGKEIFKARDFLETGEKLDALRKDPIYGGYRGKADRIGALEDTSKKFRDQYQDSYFTDPMTGRPSADIFSIRQQQQADAEAQEQKGRDQRAKEFADKYTDTSSGLELFASGGLANLTRTIPPEKGPQSQGLASFMKNGKR